jgi:hypothetical protein
MDFGELRLRSTAAHFSANLNWNENEREKSGNDRYSDVLAEEVRFELTEGLTLRWFSRPVP